MSNWLHFCRKGLVFGVACGLGMIAFAGQITRAGIIEIDISESGLTPVTVNLGSGLEGPGTDSNHVTAAVLALNSTLDGLGYDFHFNALGAVANSPGTGGQSFLDLTGQVFRTTATGGDKTIQIDASQNDYATLGSLTGNLHNFITANFHNASAGNSQTGTSYLNTSNVLNDTAGAISTTPVVFNPPGGSGSAPDIAVPTTPVFSLTDRIVVTLSADVSGGVTPPFDQFTHHTAVISVPEPMSLALLVTGLPVVILRWLRRRRAAA